MPFIPWRNRHKKPGMPHAGQGLPGGAPSPSLPGLSGPLPMSSGLPSAPSSLGSGPMMRGGQVGGAGSGVYRMDMQRKGGMADGGDPLNALFEHNIGEDDSSPDPGGWRGYAAGMQNPLTPVDVARGLYEGGKEVATHPVATAAGLMDPWDLTTKAYKAFDDVAGTNSASRLQAGQDESPVASEVGRAGGELLALGPAERAATGLLGAVKSAPVATASGLAGMTMGFPSEASDQGPAVKIDPIDIAPMLQQRAEISQERDKQKLLMDANARKPGPIYDRATAQFNLLNSKLEALDQQIADARKHNSPEHALDLQRQANEQEQQRREKLANTPFKELYADYMPYVPLVAGTLAGGLGGTMKGMAMGRYNKAMGDISKGWEDAVTKRNLPLAQAYQDKAEELVPKSGLGGWAPVLAGAGIGEVSQLGPVAIDYARAKPGSDLYDKTVSTMTNGPEVAGRMLTGALLGGIPAEVAALGVGAVGKKYAKTYEPETQALAQAQARKLAQPGNPGMVLNQIPAAPPQAQLPAPGNAGNQIVPYDKLPRSEIDQIRALWNKYSGPVGVPQPQSFNNEVGQVYAQNNPGRQLEDISNRVDKTNKSALAKYKATAVWPRGGSAIFNPRDGKLAVPGTVVVGDALLNGDDSERSSGGTVRGSDEDNISRALRHTSGHWEKQRRDREGRWTGGYVGRKK